MPVNNFLPFCPTSTGTNLLTQGDYDVATDRDIGNQPGIASSKLVNKALRQASAVAAQFAQYLVNVTGQDALDDGSDSNLLGLMNVAFQSATPDIQTILSGSGTYHITYIFQVTSATASVGATYTNNSATFTVKSTIAVGSTLYMTGTGAPAGSGTLTKATGTGDATISFVAVSAPRYLHIKMIGGGGGGGADETDSSGIDGGAANPTTFGTSLLSAGGGGGGPKGVDVLPADGGAGGTNTANSGPVILVNIAGSPGGGNSMATGSGAEYNAGANGGSTPFGGTGMGSAGIASGGRNSPCQTAVPNSGAGGGGGGTQNGRCTGGGGGAGGYLEAMIFSPSPTYAYSIGAGGAKGPSGTYGVGGSGQIIVIGFY